MWFNLQCCQKIEIILLNLLPENITVESFIHSISVWNFMTLSAFLVIRSSSSLNSKKTTNVEFSKYCNIFFTRKIRSGFFLNKFSLKVWKNLKWPQRSVLLEVFFSTTKVRISKTRPVQQVYADSKNTFRQKLHIRSSSGCWISLWPAILDKGGGEISQIKQNRLFCGIFSGWF